MTTRSALGTASSVILSLLLLPAALADTAPAERALQQGRADEAAHLLQTVLQAEPQNATAHGLLCRVFYEEELADAAIPECERAAALAPTSSNDQMWLGRAYGLKALNAGPFAGLSLAKKVRVSFEQAVQMDPANVPAAAALGEFYVAAPALVGGGLDKARRLAGDLERHSPAAAHRLLGMAAEKGKDMATAEREYRLALAAAKTPEAWTDLGDFYRRAGEPDKEAAALQSAIGADRSHGPALVDVAGILTEAHRSPELAEKVLRWYLDSPAKSAAAPAFKVHVQLGRLLAQRGDAAGAREQYQAALDLASAYAPARKALGRR